MKINRIWFQIFSLGIVISLSIGGIAWAKEASHAVLLKTRKVETRSPMNTLGLPTIRINVKNLKTFCKFKCEDPQNPTKTTTCAYQIVGSYSCNEINTSYCEENFDKGKCIESL